MFHYFKAPMLNFPKIFNMYVSRSSKRCKVLANWNDQQLEVFFLLEVLGKTAQIHFLFRNVDVISFQCLNVRLLSAIEWYMQSALKFINSLWDAAIWLANLRFFGLITSLFSRNEIHWWLPLSWKGLSSESRRGGGGGPSERIKGWAPKRFFFYKDPKKIF